MKRTTVYAIRQLIGALASAGLLAACSPTFDWREIRLDRVAPNALLSSMFPCKPDHHARLLQLNDQRTTMQMAVCAAGGTTFALSAVPVADPSAAGAGLQQLRMAAVANVQGDAPSLSPWRIPGMTPSDQAVRLTIRGRLPDGAPVIEHAAFFVQGLMLYQASVIGAKPNPEVVETFFTGLKFMP